MSDRDRDPDPVRLDLNLPRGLDDMLNYRLIRLSALSGAPVTRLCEGRYGISRREWRVLALVARHGTLSPSELAERVSLDRARTSKAITALAAKKLLTRTAVNGDRRRALVGLTPKGQHLYEALFPQVVEINQRVLSALDRSEVQAFASALERLTEHAAVVNRQLAVDVQADRHRGGSRQHRPLAADETD